MDEPKEIAESRRREIKSGYSILLYSRQHRTIRGMGKNAGWAQRFKTIEQRFRDKVVEITPASGCWLLAGKEYGRFWDGKRLVKTHRFAFEHFVRPLKEGECVCHKCDEPRCVNPAHLFAATHTQNVQDCIHKGRGNKRRGEMVNTAKVTREQVEAARLRFTGKRGEAAQIARELGLSKSATSSLLRGQSWK